MRTSDYLAVLESVLRRVSALKWFACLVPALCALGALAKGDPLSSEKLIAVGEGRDGYFCYLGGDRMTLYAFGLDVLSGYPEAASLLDGMIDYLVGVEN